jgi:ubiquinone/menaquinone biosynthesis C-methylase UbiE
MLCCGCEAITGEQAVTNTESGSHDDRFFAACYSRISQSRAFRKQFDPYRRELTQAACGLVLEVGAGGGQNFGFYDPAITARVEAVEPNAYMLARAREAAETARVPIHLTAAPAEELPFADATFDAALATLVFCSVDDPTRGLHEMRRVLKPGGTLLLFEHVRSRSRGWARLQDWLTPLQTRIAGNCHLNRATSEMVRTEGFAVQSEIWLGGAVHPMVAIIATKADNAAQQHA